MATACNGQQSATLVAVKQDASTQMPDNEEQQGKNIKSIYNEQTAQQETYQRGDGSNVCDKIKDTQSSAPSVESTGTSYNGGILQKLLRKAKLQKDRITTIRHQHANRYNVLFNAKRIVIIDFDLFLMLMELYFMWPFGLLLIAYYFVKIACRLWFNKEIPFKVFANVEIEINQEQ